MMSKLQAQMLLLLITMSWGASYLFTKFALREIDPFALVGYRYLLAFIVTFIFFYNIIKQVRKQTIAASAILGLLLAAVSITFSYGLQTVDASTASFLVATTVIFVPTIMAILTRKLPHLYILLGGGLALCGLAVFTLNGTFTLSTGSMLCLLSALLYAVHIVCNHFFVREHDGLQLGVIQLGFAGLISFLLSLAVEGFHSPYSMFGWGALMGIAIISSAFTVIAQSIVQKYTTATATGFILSLEPIFAALLAFLFLNDHMTVREYIGGAIIFIGVLVANIPRSKLKK